MTSAQGSGVRGRLRPSASGFSSARCFASAALHGVAAELLAQRGVDLRRERLVLARGEAREERHRDRRRRHALVDRVEHRPAALARVVDVAADLLQAGVLFSASTSRSSSQLRTTEPCCQSAGDLVQVERELRGLHDLEALRERLHHPVLDPVVDHLHEVAGAGRADVRVAALLGQVLRGTARSACMRRRRRRPSRSSPPSAPRSRRRRRRRGSETPASSPPRRPTLRVAEVRVAAVDDDVARPRAAARSVWKAFSVGVARRDHQPHDARLGELRRELDQRVRRALRVRARVRLDGVAVLAQPLRHVRAHPAEADHSEIHVMSSSRMRATGRPRSFSAA